MKAVQARVYGRVQNVYYRASAQTAGDRLGLRGWVMNVADGSVALHAQGSDEAVDAFLEWCAVGPPAARVERVEATDAEPDESLLRFEVR
jgi:acylphosphatase